eukprot:365500-Chlamydomonas_euryale.AAC.5
MGLNLNDGRKRHLLGGRGNQGVGLSEQRIQEIGSTSCERGLSHGAARHEQGCLNQIRHAAEAGNLQVACFILQRLLRKLLCHPAMEACRLAVEARQSASLRLRTAGLPTAAVEAGDGSTYACVLQPPPILCFALLATPGPFRH